MKARSFLAGLLVGVVLATAAGAGAAAATLWNGFVTVNLVVNGKAVSGEPPAILVNNSTYIPLRRAAEVLGASVSWDNSTKTAVIASEPADAPSGVSSPPAPPPAPAVVSGRVIPSAVCIPARQLFDFAAEFVDSAGTVAATTVTWSSSDIDKVYLDPNTGAVQIGWPGTYIITARAANGVTATATVEVREGSC